MYEQDWMCKEYDGVDALQGRFWILATIKNSIQQFPPNPCFAVRFGEFSEDVRCSSGKHHHGRSVARGDGRGGRDVKEDGAVLHAVREPGPRGCRVPGCDQRKGDGRLLPRRPSGITFTRRQTSFFPLLTRNYAEP